MSQSCASPSTTIPAIGPFCPPAPSAPAGRAMITVLARCGFQGGSTPP